MCKCSASRYPERSHSAGFFITIPRLEPAEGRKPVYLEKHQYEESRNKTGNIGGGADQDADGGYRPDRGCGGQALNDSLLPLKDDSGPQKANAGDDALYDAVSRFGKASDGDAGE